MFQFQFLSVSTVFACAVPESHCPQDVVEVVGREEVLLLDIEEVETELEDLDLVRLKSRGLRYLVKVDVRELQEEDRDGNYKKVAKNVYYSLIWDFSPGWLGPRPSWRQ